MAEVAQLDAQGTIQADRRTASFRIPRSNDKLSMPLSTAQQQIWLHSRLVPNVSFYNEPVTFLRDGPLHLRALERTFTEIVRRHSAWRTSFTVRDGEPIQVVNPPAPMRFPAVDLSNLPFSQREPEALRLASEMAVQPFDLSRDPLFRGLVVHLSETEHRLFLALHHIVFDGYSISRVLLPELVALYSAYSSGQTPALDELAIQYSDFAVWQQGWLARQSNGSSQLEYWRNQLAGELPVLQLPTDRTRTPVPSLLGASEPINIERDLSASLNRLGRSESATLFMTLLAAFAVLLQRYTSSSDITIGTASSGRKRVELEGLLGCFINPVALRIDLSGGPTFRELLRRARTTTLEALSNDDVPFTEVVNAVRSNHTFSSHPLFQVLLTLEPSPVTAADGWNVSLTQPGVDTGTSRFDLSLELDNRFDGIVGRLRYSTDLFDRETILRLKGNLATLLNSIASNPDQRISKLRMLTAQEERQISVDWNTTAGELYSEELLHHLFMRQAERTPDAIALTVGSDHLTYRELDARTNQLANYLRERGVRPEKSVGLYLEPSIEMILATLAVLKAGGVCVPLDPSYPTERLSYAIEDAQLQLLLTKQPLRAQLPCADDTILCLDSGLEKIAQSASTPVLSSCTPQNLAYVIYTSGSTGKPKGVLINHCNLVHSTLARMLYYGDDQATFLMLSSFSFDSSLAGILGTLCQGGMLVLTPGPLKSNLTQLSHLVQQHKITRLLCVPSLYSLILEQANRGELASLKEAILGGECCSPELVARHYAVAPHATLFNEYGPTEAAVWSTVYKCSPNDSAGLVPIGKPISNSRVFVLDPHRNLTPVGRSRSGARIFESAGRDG
jgi:amino acid adenylation domain-containing protein